MNKGRKISGGKYRPNRKKKYYEKTNQEKVVLLGDTKTKKIKIQGGKSKTILLKSDMANVSTLTGKIKKVEIKNVLETPQNRFLARQNRLMKGVIIDTAEGKAKITNRPSREGSINAVLIEKA
jgi:small subunit ribosomal protein S8e